MHKQHAVSLPPQGSACLAILSTLLLLPCVIAMGMCAPPLPPPFQPASRYGSKLPLLPTSAVLCLIISSVSYYACIVMPTVDWCRLIQRQQEMLCRKSLEIMREGPGTLAMELLLPSSPVLHSWTVSKYPLHLTSCWEKALRMWMMMCVDRWCLQVCRVSMHLKSEQPFDRIIC